MKNYELISKLEKLPAGAEYHLIVSVCQMKLTYKRILIVQKFTMCQREYVMLICKMAESC
jgi:hypothetical protein